VYTGEAMAMGERTPVAVNNAAASARLAVGEALTNLAAAQIGDLGKVNLSANWMAAPAHAGDGADLYAAVHAVGMELCPALGITIPVGKDSMSMSTVWKDAVSGEQKRMTAPVSLIVSAFASCADIRRTLTPQLCCDRNVTTANTERTKIAKADKSESSPRFSSVVQNKTSGDTVLLLIDLGRGKNRLGGSILAQVISQMGEATPDVDSATDLKNFWNAIQLLGREGKVLAYHDRSDGGLFATIVEMAFAGHVGVDLELAPAPRFSATSTAANSALSQLFNEELGAVIQVRGDDLDHVSSVFRRHGLKACVSRIGTLNPHFALRITQPGSGEPTLFNENLSTLRAVWSDVSRRIAGLRDNPACAESEHQLKLERDNPGITPVVTFDYAGSAGGSPTLLKPRPPVAILREQGVNGQVEMGAALTLAGFRAIDVHMTDILSGRASLADFRGVIACGGFSFGDTLGAGEGWAKSILFNDRARAEFASFFARPDTFALGVCNGCQMMSNLREIIPGADHWPRFVQNQSERFEARFSSVKIEKTPSVLFAGMEGSVLPIAVAHGEGFADFPDADAARRCSDSGLVCARFVDNHHRVTERYPLNPNGSPYGMTAVTTQDGRVTIMMPHPERVFRTVAMSWCPPEWGENSPWMKLFENARTWIG
jgi:phosphoribosylformylglycinamidine synthase